MTAQEIQAALLADPQHVFAERPGKYGLGPSLVRGLTSSSFKDHWQFAEYRQPMHPDPSMRGWQSTTKSVITIRACNLVTVEVADTIFAERRRKQEAQQDARAAAARLVARLKLLGVAAGEAGDQVVVRDVAALDALLDRLGAGAGFQ